ncbi:uncharacterized protein LOC132605154 [Lycium barbarum]|uniref:uncharacterized protein LOC132605154 n=1 Tax=Lycium barbarum TaxID=112863 RepID=UPI00293ECD7C|nr:uncharacterized protein LOC132605154 [Lycium barbarum]
MNQQENQDLASSLPALPRLDRLDRLHFCISRSSSSSGHVSVTVGQAQDQKSKLRDRKGPDHLVVEEKGLTNEIPLTKKTEQSTITNKSRIERRISLRKLLGWLRLGC